MGSPTALEIVCQNEIPNSTLNKVDSNAYHLKFLGQKSPDLSSYSQEIDSITPMIEKVYLVAFKKSDSTSRKLDIIVTRDKSLEEQIKQFQNLPK